MGTEIMILILFIMIETEKRGVEEASHLLYHLLVLICPGFYLSCDMNIYIELSHKNTEAVSKYTR